ncbi:bifunctional diaminohydroxyphosphoribosylaminopyrimidine deaminase/5-amino-6-(5-phosphoribosylamino)uracil reductase [Aureimonas sp. Leaf454]|uniref:bifunctional diaminohydroxyphosphoribosylaminopyrimidine deaminase/5-amino-6-(5-phosphoribosylamino)uracil reductase RibD n=1 Tax=Aureimonas sp. Leaf454 TaxID=1736381 RepID=UPI0006F57663|nr:bifunctional diaminohydroxyphosphoribosylaminopyrimidine deaminase/5-amino-6-(5-phosphoribosylamino)uracil reductase RibD [Aureimonas sp. Leaf454]KQT50763.1 bifunctional diaminohydroxyphosphoribosylaminopyrimidine deaminase/5-amino-6-(5-phosphoribosylamino)uracil reductase [Aureimonas sp. Leaf454]
MIDDAATALDRRFMAAAIRFSERHTGLTGTNPSVATLLVRDDGRGPWIVGRGITAPGGRPHAETQAINEAGALGPGATAYVTLEPCAHHGRTPPCAEALVRAGIARTVSASGDPDDRVDGRGHAILRAAGIEVATRVLAADAARAMSGYLRRSTERRPEVTLKLAISRDGCIGRKGEGQIYITGPIANRQTHLLRARSDAILVGLGTLLADDPQLTCRLPGLEGRSPLRIVLDTRLEAPLSAGLVQTARRVPTALAVIAEKASASAEPFRAAGCAILACEADPASGRVALPELLEDLAARGISSVLVEGGAGVARAVLEEDLVDRLILVEGADEIGAGGLASPLDPHDVPDRFLRSRILHLGRDRWTEYERRVRS